MKQWEGIDDSGNKITENDINWELVKNRIKELSFNNNGTIISLPKNLEYIQGKTASASLGSGKINILSRYIGFKCRNNIFKVRIDEITNNISIEIEDDPNYLCDK